MASNHKPVSVFSSSNSAIISVAKSLLNESGIKFTVSGNGVTEIFVTGDEDVIKARKILMDLEELDFQE
ncbi:MAG: DUF2007 domain-containing protein [Ignavibacteria bacterium]|nr:DUF2007 domain-containing protein [Ignavibacteria bacterium]